MKKRGLAVILMAAMIFGVTGCGEQERKEPVNVDNYLETMEFTETEEISGELAAGINHFGLELFSHLPKDENQFFSPYSITQAISVLNVGAGTGTKQEMEDMLGIADAESWNSQMKAFMEKEWSMDTKLLTANSLWVNPNSFWSESVEPDFFAPTKFYYNCESFEADFANEFDKVSKQITKWVDENTNGMIPDYKTASSKDTAMSIINAVFFEGKWEYPFKGKDTQADGTFLSQNGEWERNVPLMEQWNVNLRYFETEDFQGAELPYKDSTLVMDILLPKNNDIMTYQNLSVEEQTTLWDMFDEAGKEEIETLILPAFTMDLSILELPKILMDMGMVNAFSETADLDKIGKDIFVSDVAHRAKIEVFEEGTRAAAITEIVTMESAAMPMPDIIEFIVNSPFVYVIRDTETGIILFMGQVTTMK